MEHQLLLKLCTPKIKPFLKIKTPPLTKISHVNVSPPQNTPQFHVNLTPSVDFSNFGVAAERGPVYVTLCMFYDGVAPYRGFTPRLTRRPLVAGGRVVVIS